MTLVYATKLGLETMTTDVGAQKIDYLLLKTYGMAITGLLLQDRLARIRFFVETFLLAETNMKIVLGMLFLSFSNIYIQFMLKDLLGEIIYFCKAFV